MSENDADSTQSSVALSDAFRAASFTSPATLCAAPFAFATFAFATFLPPTFSRSLVLPAASSQHKQSTEAAMVPSHPAAHRAKISALIHV
jgi:hypothetical protein